MQTMKHKSNLLKISARTFMLKEKWLRCGAFLRHRDMRRTGSLGSLNVFSRLGEALRMYYVGPIKGKYLLMKLDYLNKLVELNVCSQKDNGHPIRGIEKWRSFRGLTNTLLTDGAKPFNNVEMRRWVEDRGADHIKILAYDHCRTKTLEQCVCSVLQLSKKQQSANLGVKWWDLIPKVEKKLE